MIEERRQLSFYGGMGGITSHDVDRKISNNNEQIIEPLINNHIVVSKTQPAGQQEGDI